MSKAQDLIKLAEADLKVSELLLNSYNDELMQNNAAYHTEQALEKLMKSIKESNGANATITHSITALWKDLQEMDIEVPEWVFEMDDEISSWATTIRYNAIFKAVLVAVSIPVFTAQLNNAKLATDVANVRAYLAERISTEMAETSPNYNVTQAQIDGAMTKGSTATLNNTAHTISVDLTGATNGPVVITVDPDITLVP